jgi:hypothetical protein
MADGKPISDKLSRDAVDDHRAPEPGKVAAGRQDPAG